MFLSFDPTVTASGSEIITVQVGHYANAVGAHFWNAQQQIDTRGGEGLRSTDLAQDRLFRTGYVLGPHAGCYKHRVPLERRGSARVHCGRAGVRLLSSTIHKQHFPPSFPQQTPTLPWPAASFPESFNLSICRGPLP